MKKQDKVQDSKTAVQRYKGIQIKLHWLTLLLVIATYSTIYLSEFFPRPIEIMLRNFHFNLGILVWCVIVIRLLLQIIFKSPPINPPLSKFQRIASKSVHHLIYLVFLIQPLLGLFTRAYDGRSWSFMGLQIDSFVTVNEDFSFKLHQVHETVAIFAMLLIGLHAAAALFHHYVRRDDTLLRMMPERKK